MGFLCIMGINQKQEVLSIELKRERITKNEEENGVKIDGTKLMMPICKMQTKGMQQQIVIIMN